MTDLIPTEEQRTAIEHQGSMVAIAKPGSGKTFVLSEKIRRATEGSASHRGVIAISYTNMASDELKRRATAGGAGTKASFFGTINKFCDGEIVIPFLPHLWGASSEEISILRIRELPQEERDSFEEISDPLSVDDVDRNVGVLRSQFLAGRLFVEASGALALYVLSNSAACRNYIRARYSHVIIDEYQDSGQEQHDLFLRLRELGLIAVAVGDADQSIFGFSNKDSKYLLSLAGDDNFKSFPITFNYRCHPSIINYSMRLLDGGAAQLTADEIRVFYKSCAGHLNSVAAWISESLPALMERYSVTKASDVGILVRSTRTGDAIDQALTMRHRYFYAHPMEEHFSLWAKLFCRLLAYKFNRAHTVREIIDDTVSQLTGPETKPIVKLIKKLRSEENEADLYSQMEAIAMLLLPDARKDDVVALLRGTTLAEWGRSFGPADEGEIQLMTLHKSKGLEFDIVFHLDLTEWVFPYKQVGPGNDFNNPEYPSWEQDRNLHYVGITRARKACFLCTSTRRINSNGEDKQGKPSELFYENKLSELRLVSDL